MGQLPMLRMLTAMNGCRLSLFPRIAQIRALMRHECAAASDCGLTSGALEPFGESKNSS
jgi:hypothetical protein